MASKIIPAAGGIVWRKTGAGGIEVLVVHRPDYDDWTFPKGKADPDEPLPVTAVREIAEETGYRVRLVHPLPEVAYRVRGGIKQVSWWVARPLDDRSDFRPNQEVDEVCWFAPREARKRLTYSHDRRLLESFEDLVAQKAHKARTLIVLRHAKSVPRAEFGGGDLDRPLAAAGHDRAKELVPLLTAFGVRRIVSSPATRTVQTVDPYVAATDELLEIDDRLVEGASAGKVDRAVEALLGTKRPTVACTHRPTLPAIYASLDISGPVLPAGRGLVVHHRKGKVLASELI
ncbi:NUDIX domain-containing protein [Aeromicrobium sp. 636]|uniref:NUDIX hydrolase n=1 Tax=Aeromicrobium senzhongii TaxID=2663859 RepID=A0A8I0EVZ7_9ACTN|nr:MULTISPECIES: bifunctional NUDIX hydrolase/histidine phosphatase family protein [Aeromicrobium]MBC9227204.1 NUDIX hydrolase [Aeromicrobium senzhongii]MCQ3999303.1 NUDIX domain-containing protein [Aeromicrobium sp. 636]